MREENLEEKAPRRKENGNPRRRKERGTGEIAVRSDLALYRLGRTPASRCLEGPEVHHPSSSPQGLGMSEH